MQNVIKLFWYDDILLLLHLNKLPAFYSNTVKSSLGSDYIPELLQALVWLSDCKLSKM